MTGDYGYKIMKKQSVNYQRAKDMVLQDRLEINNDEFCRELKGFLENYFTFEKLTVNFVEGRTSDVVFCVTVSAVKNARSI